MTLQGVGYVFAALAYSGERQPPKPEQLGAESRRVMCHPGVYGTNPPPSVSAGTDNDCAWTWTS